MNTWLHNVKFDKEGGGGGTSTGTEEKEPGGEAAPKQQFVPMEEFKRVEALYQETNAKLDQVNQILIRLSQDRAVVPPPAKGGEESEVTAAEYEVACRDGDGATMRRYTEQLAAKSRKEISRIETMGVSSLANINKALALPRMPYYNKFKDEVEKYFDALAPDAKLSPEGYLIAYNAVVGMHVSEIEAETREKTLRQANDPANANTPGSGSGRPKGGDGKELPTVEQLFGSEAASALRAKGKTEDQFAQSLGYENWGAYVKLAQEQSA